MYLQGGSGKGTNDKWSHREGFGSHVRASDMKSVIIGNPRENINSVETENSYFETVNAFPYPDI